MLGSVIEVFLEGFEGQNTTCDTRVVTGKEGRDAVSLVRFWRQTHWMDRFHSQNNCRQVIGAQRADARVQLGNLEEGHIRLLCGGRGLERKAMATEVVSRMLAKALRCRGRRSTW